jgi:PKD repeat protein
MKNIITILFLLGFVVFTTQVLKAQGTTCGGATALTPGTDAVGVLNDATTTPLVAGDCNSGDSATGSSTPDCQYHWYTVSLTAGETVNLAIDVTNSSTRDVRLELYSGTCASLTKVGCDGGSSRPNTSDARLNYTAPATGTYYVRVTDYQCNADIEYRLSITGANCSNATSLTSGTEVLGAIIDPTTTTVATTCPSSDSPAGTSGCFYNWYSFTTTQAQTIDIAAAVITGNIANAQSQDLRIELLSSTTNACGGTFSSLACSSPNNSSAAATLTYIALAAGTYFVRVVDNNCNADVVYNLKMTLTSAPCSATTLTSGTALTGQVLNDVTAVNASANATVGGGSGGGCASSDSDPVGATVGCGYRWYSITLAQAQTIEVAVSNGAGDMRVELYSGASCSALTQHACDVSTSQGIVSYIAPSAGTYYVRVTDFSCDATRIFDIKATLTSAPCNATALAVGTTTGLTLTDVTAVSGTVGAGAGGICATTDYNNPPTAIVGCGYAWYTFSVPANTPIELSLSTATGARIELYSGSSCTTFTPRDCASGTNPSVTYTSATATTYWVRVTDTNCDANLTYSLNLAVIQNVLADADKTINIDCGATYNFYDSGGPGGDDTGLYGNSQNNDVTFVAPAGQSVRLTFKNVWRGDIGYCSTGNGYNAIRIDNGQTGGCSVGDYLTIYDGAAGSNIVGVYTGTTAFYPSPGTIISSGNTLTVNFTSGSSGVEEGWEAVVECVSDITENPTDITINCGLGTTFTDDAFNAGGNTNIQPNDQYVVTYCPGTPGYCAFAGALSGTAILNLNDNSDVLYVYNNDQATGNPIAVLTGGDPNVSNTVACGGAAANSNTITGLTAFLAGNPNGCLTFKFVSSNATKDPSWAARSGWSLPIECVECDLGNGGGAEVASATPITSNGFWAGSSVNDTGNSDSGNNTGCNDTGTDFVLNSAGCLESEITRLENTIWYKLVTPAGMCLASDPIIQVNYVNCQNYSSSGSGTNAGNGIQFVLWEMTPNGGNINFTGEGDTWDNNNNGTAVGNNNMVYCEDKITAGEYINMPCLKANTTYYIMVDGFTGQHCFFDMYVDVFPATITAPPSLLPSSVCSNGTFTITQSAKRDIEFVYSTLNLTDRNQIYSLSGGPQSLGTGYTSDGLTYTLTGAQLPTNTGCAPVTYYIYSIAADFPESAGECGADYQSAACRPYTQTPILVYPTPPVTTFGATCSFNVDPNCGAANGNFIVEYSANGTTGWATESATVPPTPPAGGGNYYYRVSYTGAPSGCGAVGQTIAYGPNCAAGGCTPPTMTFTNTTATICATSAATSVNFAYSALASGSSGIPNRYDLSQLFGTTIAGLPLTAQTLASAPSNIVLSVPANTPAGSYTFNVRIYNDTGETCYTDYPIQLTINPIPTATLTNDGPKCVGSTVNLTATGGGTYAWSAGVTAGVGGAATVIASGTYTVTVTNNTCSSTATTAVTINTIPAPTALSVNPICPGSTTATLNYNAGVAGTLVVTAGTANINSQAFTVASGAASVSVAIPNNLTNGQTISASLNVNGCISPMATTPIIIHAAPDANFTSNSPQCQGTAIDFNASTSTAGAGTISTYDWSFGDGTTATGATPSHTYAGTGTYQVSLTITTSNGCINTETKTVTVNAIPVAAISGNTSVCNAGTGTPTTTTLTASGGATYDWSNIAANDGAANANVGTGTYTVTVTSVAGCTSTASVTVVGTNCTGVSNCIVDAGPDPANFCVGTSSSVNLNATPAASGSSGTWSCLNCPTTPTYGGATSASTTASGLSAAGTYTFVWTVAGATCNGQDNAVVTVFPTPPAPTAAGQSYCPAETIAAVTASGLAGATFTWYSNVALTTVIDSDNTYTPTADGIVYVTQTVNGCQSPATTVTTTINANPTAAFTTDSPACLGEPIVFTNTSTGAASYLWAFGDNTNSLIASPTHTYTVAGTYTVTLTATSSQGCTNSTTQNVVVNPNPTASISGTLTVCVATPTTTTLTASGGGSYSWTASSGGTISGATNTSAITATTAGTYTVLVTSAAGCTATSAVNVTDNCSAIPCTVNAGPDPADFCVGTASTVTLNAIAAPSGHTGTWTCTSCPTAVTFNNATAPSTIANGLTVAGDYVFTWTVTGANCNGQDNAIVTVFPTPPAPTAAGQSYCPAETIAAVTASGLAGATFTWYSNVALTTVIDSDNTYTPTADGIVYVTQTVNGCQSPATTVTTTINANPTAAFTTDSPACLGEPIVFTNTSTGAASYLWAFGDNTNSLLASPTHTYTAAGTYTVTLTATSSTGCTNSTTQNVVVNANPTASIAGTLTVCVATSTTTTLTASGGSTYSWAASGGGTISGATNTAAITATTAGTYTVLVTSAAGCTATATVNVTDNCSAIPCTVNAGPDPADFCVGTASTVTLNAIAAPSGHTGTWTCASCPTAVTFNNATAPSTIANGLTVAGDYVFTWTVTGANCNGQDNAIVTVFPTPPAPTAAGQSYCPAETIAAVTASGLAGATFTWYSDAALTTVIDNDATYTPTGDGIVYVTQTVNGCQSPATTVTTTINANPTAAFTTDSPACLGEPIVFTNTSTGAASYLWAFGDNTNSLIASPTHTYTVAGTYTVTLTATSSQGCTNSTTQNVVVNPNPTASISGTLTVCVATSTNTTLTASGGSSYSWTASSGGTISGATNTSAITATTAGTYTVLVTSAAGCTATATVNVTDNCSAIPCTVNAGPDPADFCVGTASTVTLNAIAAPSGHTGTWTCASCPTAVTFNNATAPSTIANGLTVAGDYVFTWTVTGANCNGQDNAIVTVFPTPPAPTAAGQSYCPAETIAAVTASGLAGATFTWYSNVALTTVIDSDNTYTPTADGIVYVTQTVNGCQSPATTVTTTINANPTAAFTTDSPACLGEPIVFTNTSTGAASYLWAFGDNTNSLIASPTHTYTVAGTYTVTLTATSSQGCTNSTTQNVVVNPNPTASISGTLTVCVATSTNTTLTASGGSSYSWTASSGGTISGATNTAAITATTAGTYTVLVTSAAGCTATATVNVTDNCSAIPCTVNAGPDPADFCVGTASTVTLNAIAAPSGHTGTWTCASCPTAVTFNNATAPSTIANGLTVAGDYVFTWTVTGANCNGQDNAIVTVFPTPPAPTAAGQSYCPAETIAAVTASGLAGATFTWYSDAALTTVIDNDATYTPTGDGIVYVTQTVNGCQSPATTVTTTINANPTAAFTTDSPACLGEPIVFTNTSTGAASYLWAFGDNTNSLIASPTHTYTVAGTYTVTLTATSSQGCTNSTTQNVVVNPNPTASISGTLTVCVATSTNTTLTASGGSSYSWTASSGGTISGATNTSAITATTAGTYTVLVTSAAGCTATATVNVTDNCSAIPCTVNAGPDPADFCVGTASTVTLNAIAAPSGHTGTWTCASCPTAVTFNNATAPSTIANGLTVAGDYVFTWTVTGANCNGQDNAIVTVFPTPPAPTAAGQSYCPAETIAAVTASGLAGATFTWYSDAALTTVIDNDATYTPTGDGIVYVTQTVNGCQSPATAVTTTVNDNPVAAFTTDSPVVVCEGDDITLTATGGTSYLWTLIDVSTATNNPLIITNATTADSGTYSVVVTDTNGCTDTEQTSIVINPIPANPVAAGGTFCTIADITPITATGAATATFTWYSDANLTTIIDTDATYTPTAAGSVYVTQTVNGCQSPATTVTTTISGTPNAPIANGATYCAGDNPAALTVLNPVAGATITWYSDVALTTQVGTGTSFDAGATISTTTTYYVTQTIGTCVSPATPVTITVNAIPAAPNATSPAPYCQGDVIAAITATGNVGATFTWYSDAALTTIINNTASYTPSASGVFYVTQTLNGCPSVATPVDVVINPLPNAAILGNSLVCTDAGAITTLTATGGTSYLWNTGETDAAVDKGAGTYTVTVTAANGCTKSATVTVVATSTVCAPGVNVSGSVFNETVSYNGLSATETPIAGNIVSLYDSNGFIIAQTQTTAAGTYQFTNVPNGTYTVGFATPNGLAPTIANAVGNASVSDTGDSDMNPNGQTNSFAVAGADVTNVDAGFVATGSISGIVFGDTNGDGQDTDVDPTVYPNVTVSLLNANGTTIATTTTDINGAYTFDDVLPGDYTVVVDVTDTDLPPTATLSPQNIGNDATNSDIDAAGNAPVTVPIGTNVSDIDAGIVPPATYTLAGTVFVDDAGNGLQDNADAGLKGVTVFLFNANNLNDPVSVNITDDNGNYDFNNLPPGDYVVIVVKPTTYVFTDANVDPTNDIDDSDVTNISGNNGTTTPVTITDTNVDNLDAGLFVPATIQGIAFIDTDGDGFNDNGTVIPNLTVTLTNANGTPVTDANGATVAPTTTDATGNYQFTNLVPGDYVVTFGTPPAGYNYIPQSADSDINPATGSLPVTGLTSGEVAQVDGGAIEPATLSGTAFVDNNGNGLNDDAQAVANATVTLYNANGTPVATTATNTDGDYTFTNVLPGTYYVGFSNLPAGATIINPSTDSDALAATANTPNVTVVSGSNVNDGLDVGVIAPPLL